MASQQSLTDAASSSDTAPISAPATGSAQSSQATSAPASKTPAGDDPAPPLPTSANSSASQAASNPVSSPDAGTSAAAPTEPPARSASASASVSASHPADTESAVPAPAPAPAPTPAPASSATQDSASTANSNPTSVHAVSSPSSPTPASHGHTQSVPEIPLPITKADPVVHSSAPAATATVVPSTESGRVLTPPAQVKDVSHAPLATSAAASPSPQPEVDASPSPAPAPPIASPTVSVSSVNDSEHASGMVQANAQTSQASAAATSTVTDQPETTLSTPFFMTVTDKNNHTTLSVPPVFTSVTVSQLPDGQFTSITHVIANPTGIYGVQVENQKGFFAKSGVVAGVFLVVGVVVASFVVGICLFMRRRRRPRFIDTISRPLPIPDNPFEDPRPISPPEMRYRSSFTDSTLVISGPPRRSGDSPRSPRSPFEERQHQRSPSGQSSSTRSASRLMGLGLAGVGAHGRSASMGSAEAARSRHQSGQSGVSGVGLAITSDQRIDNNAHSRREPTSTSARSSPSVYPPTLPSIHNEDIGELVDVPLDRSGSSHSIHSVTRKPVPSPEPELEHTTVVSPTPRPPQQITTRPPIIPPRSPLRTSLTTPTQPLSPPPYKRPEVPPRPPRDSLTLEMETIVLKAFEPLTPPTSLSSLSPAGSNVGHDAPTPVSPGSSSSHANPFSDTYERQMVQAGPPGIVPGQGWGLPLSPRKDTFYTRRSGSHVRIGRSTDGV
ncbi:hypothetical protein TRAPUB_4501 [Trametes pubescens]|uniref:Uncharacterized protein n=1 Tax=Trametes pubescens TaxID=154538 RepID=A0A1M2VB05_TRAPU|nr:hypothetical protein TRAPUB_4501 [Trametes pubescens]